MNGKEEKDNSNATNTQQADRQSCKQVYRVESLIYVIIIVMLRFQTNNRKLNGIERMGENENENEKEQKKVGKQKSSIRKWQIIATIISL